MAYFLSVKTSGSFLHHGDCLPDDGGFACARSATEKEGLLHEVDSLFDFLVKALMNRAIERS